MIHDIRLTATTLVFIFVVFISHTLADRHEVVPPARLQPDRTDGDPKACEEFHVELDHTVALPNIKIDHQPAHIHTQGLYVDDEHIYVTGRLERDPKRPLFLRFDRQDTSRFAVIDLSTYNSVISGQNLDHPGGFDFDGHDFWIPIARSNPQGPSAIVRVSYDPKTPFEKWQQKVAFQVEDHIGALACEKTLGYLYGANWDTKQIYVWKPDGTQTELIHREHWVRGAPRWELAVQDWKGAGEGFLVTPGALIAGGIDKSPERDSSKSRAVVELFLPHKRKRLAQIQLPPMDGFKGPLTNEGMCLYDRWLVLLPADIGQNAQLYFFKRLPPP
jgi:hypothetical protein